MFHISVNKITFPLWGFLVSISVSNGCKSKIPVILVTVVPGGRSLTSQNTEKSLLGNSGQQKAKRCFTRNRQQVFIFGPTPPASLQHMLYIQIFTI